MMRIALVCPVGLVRAPGRKALGKRPAFCPGAQRPQRPLPSLIDNISPEERLLKSHVFSTTKQSGPSRTLEIIDTDSVDKSLAFPGKSRWRGETDR